MKMELKAVKTRRRKPIHGALKLNGVTGLSGNFAIQPKTLLFYKIKNFIKTTYLLDEWGSYLASQPFTLFK